MFEKNRKIINPGNIFSEKLQFPSFFTLQKILMIHDSFWDAHVSFCCEEDILESDTILINGTPRNTRHEKTLDDMVCSAPKTASNIVNIEVKGLRYAPSVKFFASNCVGALQQ